MTSPAARSVLNDEGNANGQSSDGPVSVYGDVEDSYKHSLCGDKPGEPQVNNQVGPIQQRYTAGGTALLKVAITAHHMGFFEFELCEDAGRLSEECFAKHRLLRAGCQCDCGDGDAHACAACDECRRWWKPLMESEADTWMAREYEGILLPGDHLKEVEFAMEYTIPAGVKTSNGVIRWHYVTTNSCTASDSKPEEFWNCADVGVSDSGGDVGGSIAYDNGALAAAQPKELWSSALGGPSIAGVYAKCPKDAQGSLMPVGLPHEYAGVCGAQNENCVSLGGSGGAAYPTPSPSPSPEAGSSPGPTSASSGGSCMAGGDCDGTCVVASNPSQAVSDDDCAHCPGRSWWPCNEEGLCACSTGAATAPATPAPPAGPAPAPAPRPRGAKQLVAFVENWVACPTIEQVRGYDKVMVSFAVTYTYNPTKNVCDETCTISTPATCANTARPDLIKQWKETGTKVLISFGGAGMGGSWAGDNNDCWEHCFDRADSVVNQLVAIVADQGYDGVDIDYEYFHSDNSDKFLKDVTTGLRSMLPAGTIISHAPMDGDVAAGKRYFNVIKEVASSVDYLMPQYYNGPYNLAGLSRWAVEGAIAHMDDLVNEVFDGNASRVLFGFCISKCGGTNSNVNSAEAVSLLRDVADQIPGYGGAFFWAAADDVNFQWSSNVRWQLDSASAASSTTTPVPTPAPMPAPTSVPTAEATTSSTATPAPTTSPTTTLAPTTPPPTTSSINTPAPTTSSTATPAPTTSSTTTPSPATSSTASLSPTAAPAPASCPDLNNQPCTACLADNDLCYDMAKSSCDLYPQYRWCGASLAQSSRAKVRRQAFLGLLQSAAFTGRSAPAAEEL